MKRTLRKVEKKTDLAQKTSTATKEITRHFYSDLTQVAAFFVDKMNESFRFNEEEKQGLSEGVRIPKTAKTSILFA